MKRENIILAVVVLGIAAIFCSIASNRMSDVAMRKLELDYEMALQPVSPVELLNQNRVSEVSVAEGGRTSTIILFTLFAVLVLAGFPIAYIGMSGHTERLLKQARLLKKKPQNRRQYVPQVKTISEERPLLEGGNENWLND